MILVDSSVWIDFFRNRPTAQAEWLDRNLGIESLVVGDLILAEVLRGFKDDRGFNEARRMLAQLSQVTLGGEEIAILTVSLKSWHYVRLFILHMRNDGCKRTVRPVHGALV